MTVIKHLITTVALLGSASFCGSASAVDSNPTVKSGTWVGGIGSLDDDTLSWESARVVLEQAGDVLLGRLKTDGDRSYSLRIFDDGDSCKAAVERKQERIFSCATYDDVIVASNSDGQVPNKLMLRRIEPLTTQQLEPFVGVYETDEAQRICFRTQGQGLLMTNFTTGMIRFLYPAGNDMFVAGPAVAIPYPVGTEFQFHRVNGGKSSSVMMKSMVGSTLVAIRRPDPRIEEFVYDSFDGTKISGSLYLPAGAGPFPTFVWVHGSGPVTRLGAGSWPMYFSDLGFAVLAVDKRGVGKSEGTYGLPDRGRDNFPHMRRRAKDVAAAVTSLRKRNDIQADKIGLVGASQAGWVIPMSAQHVDVAIAVILVGGTTPLSVEAEYSRIASENASGAMLKPVDELIEQIRSFQPSDTGIERELSDMGFPCLWLYGYRDRSNPSQFCEEIIQGIAKRYDRDFTVATFANGNHGLLECRFGGSAESGTLRQLVPDLHATIAQWLIQQEWLPK